MNRLLTGLVSIIIVCFSCKPKGNQPEQTTGVIDTTKFFQVTGYFQKEINEVKKTPFYIYKIQIAKNNKDSTAIDLEQFTTLSKQFLSPDINSKEIKRNYKENIFHDQTTNSFTISYSTTNKELELQNVDVLLEEDGETVKRVLLRKFYNYPDSSAIEQMSWKTGERFQVNRIVQSTDNKETIYQTIVVWNEKNQEDKL